MTKTHSEYITLARKTDWRPLLPPMLVLLAYHLWMPFAPGFGSAISRCTSRQSP
jgi:hypothetical protein